MNHDFEIDPEETAAELRDQAMREDGYTDPHTWRPTPDTINPQRSAA